MSRCVLPRDLVVRRIVAALVSRGTLLAGVLVMASGIAGAQAYQPPSVSLPSTRMRPLDAPDTKATIKPDGVWRFALSLGASLARGNSESTTLNARADAVRVTDTTKWTLYGQALYAENEGQRTGEQIGGGSRLDTDFHPQWFGFSQVDVLRDEPANLEYRATLAAGAGRHLQRSERRSWDVLTGLAYSFDRYLEPADVDGRVVRSYGRPEWVIGEESSHRVTASTTLRQRLLVYANLRDSGRHRANLDAGIGVAMTEAMSLTVSLTVRYDSDPGAGVKSTDTLFVTGLSYKLD